MDARNRANAEKKIVVALVAVFGLTLAGSLRNMGMFGRRAAPTAVPVAAPAPAPGAPQTAGVQALHEYHERMSGAGALREAPAADGPAAGPARYTASSVRDPLKTYLPERVVERRPASNWSENTAASAPPARPPELRLQGVLLGGPVPQAIINNKVYRIGESINGAKITAIERQGVLVEFNGVTTRYTTSGGSGR